MAKTSQLVAVPTAAPATPQRVFKAAATEPAFKPIRPGHFDANGHNLIVDWRDPADLKLCIGTDADCLANAYSGSKGGTSLARSEGTRFGAFILETADGRKWFCKLSVDLVKEAGKAGK